MDFLDFGVDLGAIDGSKFYCQFIAGKMMMMNCCQFGYAQFLIHPKFTGWFGQNVKGEV